MHQCDSLLKQHAIMLLNGMLLYRDETVALKHFECMTIAQSCIAWIYCRIDAFRKHDWALQRCTTNADWQQKLHRHRAENARVLHHRNSCISFSSCCCIASCPALADLGGGLGAQDTPCIPLRKKLKEKSEEKKKEKAKKDRVSLKHARNNARK